MEVAAVESFVIQAVSEQATQSLLSTIERATRLREDLGIDSLGAVEVAAAIETEFGFEEIPGGVLDELTTVGELIDYVKSRLSVPAT